MCQGGGVQMVCFHIFPCLLYLLQIHFTFHMRLAIDTYKNLLLLYWQLFPSKWPNARWIFFTFNYNMIYLLLKFKDVLLLHNRVGKWPDLPNLRWICFTWIYPWYISFWNVSVFLWILSRHGRLSLLNKCTIFFFDCPSTCLTFLLRCRKA